MGDIDISGAVDNVTMTESVSRLYEMLFASVYDASTLVENLSRYLDFGPGGISVVDSVTGSDVVSTVPVRYFEFFRSEKAVTIGYVDRDWDITEQYPKFRVSPVNLKGMILIPGAGAPDTFSIKDGSDSGPYLYYGALSAAAVLVYPGTQCRPYIDYSECTLSAGHKFTFVW